MDCCGGWSCSHGVLNIAVLPQGNRERERGLERRGAPSPVTAQLPEGLALMSLGPSVSGCKPSHILRESGQDCPAEPSKRL